MKRIVTLYLACMPYFVSAQLDSNKLNEYFKSLEKHNKAMVSVAISENGSTLYQHAIGYNEVLSNSKNNVFTEFRIGSISKMFTAVLVAQLIESGKLKTGDKLDKFFVKVPNASKITIQHLLQHRSGLANYTNDTSYQSYMQKPITQAELLAKFEKAKPDYSPGEKFEYSNTNYALLTMIIEQITKSTFAEQVRMKICAKANLGDTRVGTMINTSNNEAQSYNFELNKWVKATETDMSVPLGAGNIVSTANDLCRFIEALFNYKLISKSSLDQMIKLEDGYGWGILRFPYNKIWYYGHTGGIDGFQSILGYNVESKNAICILGNGFNYSMNDIAIAMLNAYHNVPFVVPTFEKHTLTQDAKSKEGIYKSDKINMSITIKNEDGTLTAQATGQSAFPLEKVSENIYKFDTAGIQIEFVADEKQHILALKLKQGGMDLMFTRE